MVKVKVCGIRNQEEAEGAIYGGADALGFVFSKSPRQVEAEEAAAVIRRIPPFIAAVGVFVNEERNRVLETAALTGIRILQFHGHEPPHYLDYFKGHYGFQVIKALRIRSRKSLNEVKSYRASAFILFDTYSPRAYGGLGEPFDWGIIGQAAPDYPFILAGGLNTGNIAAALDTARPYGVDVSSGVETKGQKDPEKIRAFVKNIRGWEENGF